MRRSAKIGRKPSSAARAAVRGRGIPQSPLRGSRDSGGYDCSCQGLALAFYFADPY